MATYSSPNGRVVINDYYRTLCWRGRELRYANIYARSPSVSSNHLIALNIAQTAGTKNAEWIVPLDRAQLFANTIITMKQILASKDKAGAYQSIGQNLLFGSMSGLRRQAAKLFYSKGFGEFGQVGPLTQLNGSTTLAPLVVGTNTITMSRAAAFGIDINSQWQFADQATGLPANNASVNVVTAIQTAPAAMGFAPGTVIVTFTATAADTPAVGQYLVYLGNHNGTIAIPGELCSPNGLGRLFPTDPTERSSMLYGVDRSIYPQRLSGAFVDDSALAKATNAKYETILRALNEVRQAGAEPDVILLSSNDYAELSKEAFSFGNAGGSAGRFVQDVKSGRKSPEYSFGASDYSFTMATSVLNKAIDSPYIEDGAGYILTKESLFVPTYSNWGPVDSNNGAGVDPGRGEDPMAETDRSEESMRINIDDIFTVEPAQGSSDGSAVSVSCALYYQLCCFNSANNGTFVFPAA